MFAACQFVHTSVRQPVPVQTISDEFGGFPLLLDQAGSGIWELSGESGRSPGAVMERGRSGAPGAGR